MVLSRAWMSTALPGVLTEGPSLTTRMCVANPVMQGLVLSPLFTVVEEAPAGTPENSMPHLPLPWGSGGLSAWAGMEPWGWLLVAVFPGDVLPG